MAEKIFESISEGIWWVAVENPPPDILAGYPSDTVEVTEPQPSADHERINGAWVLHVKTKDELKEYAQSVRDTKMHTGFSFDAGTINSQTAGAKNYSCHPDKDKYLDGSSGITAYVKASAGFTQGDVNWFDSSEAFFIKANDGTKVYMDAQAFVDWYTKFSNLRKKLNDAAEDIEDDIDAETVTTTAQIDSSTHWPS